MLYLFPSILYLFLSLVYPHVIFSYLSSTNFYLSLCLYQSRFTLIAFNSLFPINVYRSSNHLYLSLSLCQSRFRRISSYPLFPILTCLFSSNLYLFLSLLIEIHSYLSIIHLYLLFNRHSHLSISIPSFVPPISLLAISIYFSIHIHSFLFQYPLTYHYLSLHCAPLPFSVHCQS